LATEETAMRHIATLLLLAATAAFAAPATPAAAPGDKPAEKPWVSLFNGRDLDGWTPKIRGYELGEDPMRTFRVEDGVIKVVYDQYDAFNNRFGHLFYKQPYTNYRLRFQYRFVGQQCPGGPGWALRNSGVMLHGQDPKTMRRDQDFPVSIEVQLLGGSGQGTRTTANMCSPGTHIVMDGKLQTTHCINSKSDTFHGDQWVTLEVEVHGGKTIRHFINSKLVMEYEQPQYDPGDGDAKKLMGDGPALLTGGTFSLQSESHPVEFRNIEIQELAE
jgi:hypothetical protein